VAEDEDREAESGVGAGRVGMDFVIWRPAGFFLLMAEGFPSAPNAPPPSPPPPDEVELPWVMVDADEEARR
jgi:hypothetical protein